MRYETYDYEAVSPIRHILFDVCRRKRCRLISDAVMAFVSVSFLLVSCAQKPSGFTSEERRAADSIVRTVHGIDSLSMLQKRLESKGDHLGSVVLLREWGKALRNESRFDEALEVHSEGLRQAEAIGDTIEWVQALNNIGTDYRRMGVLDVAQEYHYRAGILSQECTDTSFIAKKNRAVSLNGLGNVYMTLGNYERADSVLRLALASERQLGSPVGQAINYANLGSIFKQRGQVDSAWVYYHRSMAFNQEAGSHLGISLCHIYFGSLYEKAGEYDKATEEYKTAYEQMKTMKDEWHALNSLIALAGICNTVGEGKKTLEYLAEAKATAERIKSVEHLAEIYTLYYRLYRQQGDCMSALAAYETASALQDSVMDMEKVNRIQNTSLNIERNRQIRQMDEARLKLEQERTKRNVGYGIFALVVIFLIGLVAMLLYFQRLRAKNHRALKQMSRLRENFFTNITHEFRTPLTVILGLSRDLQQNENSPAEVKAKSRVIERQGNGLLTLINQLLDISKIKSAVGNPDWQNGDITAHLTMIVETYRDYARNRNIDLQFLSKETVEMDFVPDYVSKVLNNLLSNAFKFTPEYGKINVVTWRDDERLFIDVSDTGEGMEEETLAHIFEPFYRVKDTSHNTGSGVGLALVRQIIDAVGGNITVESVVGKGSVFHVSLPIHNESRQRIANPVETNKPMLPETEVEPDENEKEDYECRLLIIEDNKDVAAYIGSQLSDRYVVSYAYNGKEGLERALKLIPDLVITDLMMPGMDGLEICRQMRSNEIVNHIPIIMVTAKITEMDRIRGLEAGADAYLAKPFNSDELRMRVEKLLDGRRLLREKFAQAMIGSKDAGGKKVENALPQSDADFRFLTKVSDAIYLQLNRRKEVEVSLIASDMCMSNSQFYRKMTALTGYTPLAYIQRVKLKNAQHLMNESPQMSFGEIAELCGFNDYSNFVRAFRSVYGITPTEYRRGQSPAQ